jgi:hypothetical protein
VSARADVAVWDLADGSLSRVFRGHITGVVRSSDTNRLAHGRDEHCPWLAQADDEGTIRVRNPMTGARISTATAVRRVVGC